MEEPVKLMEMHTSVNANLDLMVKTVVKVRNRAYLNVFILIDYVNCINIIIIVIRKRTVYRDWLS